MQKMTAPSPISVYAFAKLAGVDKTTVEKAIRLGHLEDAVTKNEQGHIRIDLERGRANWARNFADTAKAPASLRAFLAAAQTQQPSSPRPAIRANEIDWENLPVSHARRIREAAKARNEQLSLDQRLGNLVHIDDVRAAQFEFAKIVRTGFQTMATTIAPELGLSHEQQVTLEKEIGKQLSSLADLDGLDFKVKSPR
jgi:hypothetical protein